jgi:hypothetical protein
MLSIVLAATVIGFGQLLQVSEDSPLGWLIPVAYVGVAVIGFIWALVMRAVRPEVYAAIGRGADVRVVAPADADFPTQNLPPVAPVGSRGGYPY